MLEEKLEQCKRVLERNELKISFKEIENEVFGCAFRNGGGIRLESRVLNRVDKFKLQKMGKYQKMQLA